MRRSTVQSLLLQRGFYGKASHNKMGHNYLILTDNFYNVIVICTYAWVAVLHVDVFIVGGVGLRATDYHHEDEEEGQAEENDEDGGEKATA
jgi:hypothetical protein